jgi:release factor glutamine methyltransferase
MINISWDKLTEIYKETDIKDKKLPEFYNYYDYSKDFKDVYEPSDDTFLFVDILMLEKKELLEKNIQNTIELGCGSGFVSCCFIMMMKKELNHFCVDINDSALKLTQGLFNNYKIKASIIKSDLFENLSSTKFDVILFNPVY